MAQKKRAKTRSAARAKAQAREIEELRARLQLSEETIRAIRAGEVDAVVVYRADGEQVFTLQTGDEPYRFFVEGMNEGAAIVAPDGTILNCNRLFARMAGGTVETTVGASIHRFIPTRTRPFLVALLEEAKLRRGSRGEVALRSRTGNILPVQMSVRLLEFDGGSVMRLIATDISEIKRAQSALQESANFNSEILDNIAEGIAVFDRGLRVRLWNPFLHRLTGLAPEWVAGRDCRKLCPGWNRSSIPELAERALKGETVSSLEVPVQFGNAGGHHWLAANLAPHRDPAGRTVGVICRFEDITEKKHADARRVAQYEVARVLAESQSLDDCATRILGVLGSHLDWDVAMFWQVDPEGNEIHCTHTWRRPGFRKAQVGKLSTPNVLPPGAGLPGVAWVAGEPLWMSDTAPVRKWPATWAGLMQTAAAFPVALTGQPVAVIVLFDRQPRPDDDDLRRFMTVVCSQLAQFIERGRAEEELRRSNARLARLARHLGAVTEEERARLAREVHDQVGQALTAIKLDLAWVEREAPPDARRVHEKLRQTARLADETIDAVRQLAAELRPRILDDLGLAAAVEWQVGEFERRVGVRCSVSVPRRPLSLPSHASTALFRILQEALTNIARHARAEKVSVGLASEDQRAVLRIADNGRGFDPAAVPDKSFGLLGMRERAEILGGGMEIDAAPGKGTTIRAWVPGRG